jgi:hypothetical protein
VALDMVDADTAFDVAKVKLADSMERMNAPRPHSFLNFCHGIRGANL